ncbi:hypothetical protein SLEP1_g40394 [Rubroshorea leprosula]|uniref:RING-type E3 ubiquitin transferase n=1 Tax=Rubroshorea leprosula TaxID=152421 RepID=A0AAV5L3V5_9ROSI|nr:hypothetical protein SLEP1_g40394 [Rubroshorea leprosula]
MSLTAVLISFLFCLLCFYTPTTTAHICQISCSGKRDAQAFCCPFGQDETSNNSCSYPRLSMSCNDQNRTILTLPNSDQLPVLAIHYKTRRINLTRPNSCIRGRCHKGSSDPTCSPLSAVKDNDDSRDPTCSFVLVLEWSKANCSLCEQLGGTCRGFKSNQCPEIECSDVSAVKDNDDSRDPTRSFVLVLEWSKANCSRCEQLGGTCRESKSNQRPEIEGSDVPSEGHPIPRSARYGIIIGIGIPIILCFVGLTCYICSRVYAYTHRRRHPTTEFLTSIALQPAVGRAGLDGPTIESYPKTLLGESRRLPNPSDNTCSICLSEYQPKEALRTIPECKHYFHADCIDKWLRMNTTCPLCRNSPGRSMSVTSSTSLSSSSSSISLVIWAV